ncbi:hypothetical protein JTB14_009762 [Gonioctena quinquepunctata]|nr:hypothetical protein JTB14_009762 [Gonioctena quinquepunctata]
MREMMHLVLPLAILLALSNSTEGITGCLNFGHSCFGGIGKRSQDAESFNNEAFPNYQNDENMLPILDDESFLQQLDQTQRIMPLPQFHHYLRSMRQLMNNYRGISNQPVQ